MLKSRVSTRDCIGSRSQDVLCIQPVPDSLDSIAFYRSLKDCPNNLCRLRIDHQVVFVLRILFIAIGRVCAGKFPLVESAPQRAFYLQRNIRGVHFIHDISEGSDINRRPVQRIHTVVYCNIADAMLREKDFQVSSAIQVVPAQPGKILCQDAVDFSCLNILDHFLESGAVEIRAAVAVIHIKVLDNPASCLHIVGENGLLRCDADAFGIRVFVFLGEPAIQTALHRFASRLNCCQAVHELFLLAGQPG